jgi:hypothetical protein
VFDAARVFIGASAQAAAGACAVYPRVVIRKKRLARYDPADREFGLDRVKAVIADHGGERLDHLERRLFEAVRGHGPQLDDQTLLLIRYC